MECVITKHVGRGDDTIFWVDHWMGDEPLKYAFPRLYQLEKNRRCLIEDRIQFGGPSWDWISRPSSEINFEELHNTLALLESFQPRTLNDGWKCVITDDGEFQVAGLGREIDKPTNQIMVDRVEWICEVPIKVIGFIWRAMQMRIPSLCALKIRGMYMDSVLCSYCLIDVGDSDHILLSCPFTKTVWTWILKWCGIPMFQVLIIGELTEYMVALGKDKDRKNN